MLKKIKILSLFVLILSGCSKEVYLQPVPCNCPCFVGQAEDCPETKLQTEEQVYLIEDIATQPTNYIYTEEKITHCTKKCRKVKK